MQDLKAKLAGLLARKSYREGDFTLASGRKSDYYFDCRQTALHPEGAYLLGRIFLDMIHGLDRPVHGVAGMTLGADPLVSAVTVVSNFHEDPLPGMLVRKKAKGYGTGAYLEGTANFPAGVAVCMLEDVVTTGGSVLLACERVREAGYRVGAVFCVLDRNEGGSGELERHGYELRSIFSREDIADAAG
ncbi:MAG: orotate phosphoribosyltransferase [Desulfonatronovibrionaceae bacterium]